MRILLQTLNMYTYKCVLFSQIVSSNTLTNNCISYQLSLCLIAMIFFKIYFHVHYILSKLINLSGMSFGCHLKTISSSQFKCKFNLTLRFNILSKRCRLVFA